MEAKYIKICRCGMAVAGNIMKCPACKSHIPDPRGDVDE